MRTIKYITSILLSVCALSGWAQIPQNTPKNTNLPAGPYTGKEVAPRNFNETPYNTTPAFFNVDRLFVPLIPMTSVPTYDGLGSLPVLVNTTYNDGWGRPVVNIKSNNAIAPAVTAVDHRPSSTNVSYLPYREPNPHPKFPMNPFYQVKRYHALNYPLEDSTGYGKTKSYANNGVPTVETYAPGAAMIGKLKGDVTTTHINGSYEVQSAATVMKLAFNGSNICSIGTYPAGQLIVTKSVGLHNRQTLEYKDKSGRLICNKVFDGGNWLTSYYLYDEQDRLAYIVPPLAVKNIVDNSGCNTIALKKLCFIYGYDNFGNNVSKQVPGKGGPDITVYDKHNRPVLSQSPSMRLANQWYFKVYDKLNRVVMSGIYTGSNNNAYWETVVDAYSNAAYSSNTTLEYWLTHHPANNTYPSSLTNCVIHTYNYYDTYADAPASSRTFDNSYAANYLAGSEMIVPVPYNEAHGRLVASKTRVLDNSIPNNFTNLPWITSVYFYDEKGQQIQTHTQNPWNTSLWDITTTQYNFSGAAVLTIEDYKGWASSTKPATTIMTKYNYIYRTAQLESVVQKIDTNAWTTLAFNTYDHLGRLYRKELGNAEIQDYKYNIRGQLAGINANYMTQATLPGNNMTYASQLCYETGFDSIRLDGKLTGYRWRTKSSTQRAYGYIYDAAGRMIQADYRDSNYTTGTPVWHANNQNYTVNGIDYDQNGNMQHMTQFGPKSVGGFGAIDQLEYKYDANQLTGVIDGGYLSILTLMDFDNGATGASSSDYTYDSSGNMTSDANKGITKIEYNFLNQPTLIVKGTDSIRNLYSADGVLLQKRIREGAVVTNYRYWGPLNYKNDSLQFVLHQEGRARWVADSGLYKYDYFVKDHQGNVRTVVCADYSLGESDYNATWEFVTANIEEYLFSDVGPVRDNKPVGTPDDAMAARLNGFDPNKRIGAAILLHAMAGDQINLEGWGYYEIDDPSRLETYAPPEMMATALTNTLIGGSGVGAGETGITAITINQLLTPMNYNIYETLRGNATDPAYPRAYLNYLVFNESMQLLPDESRVTQLRASSGVWTEMFSPGPHTMRANGYAMMYVSNETGMDAFFDNIRITHWKGRLLEEQHYYPHGLVVDGGVSSPSLKNKYLFEGNKLQEELGWQMSDFQARQYDQQIGRFTSIDPLADQSGQHMLTPYHFTGNDPANFVDPMGLDRFVHGSRGWYWEHPEDNGAAGVVLEYLGSLSTGSAKAYWGKTRPTDMIRPQGYGSGGGKPSESGKNGKDQFKMYSTPGMNKKALDAELKRQREASKIGKDIDDQKARLVQAKEYDYSQVEIADKFNDDMNYIFNGEDGNAVTRWWDTFERDWGQASFDDKANLIMTLVPIGSRRSFNHGFEYHPRVRGRALQDPSSHNFPYSFDNFILKSTPITKSNGYRIYQVPGNMNGRAGVYEIGVTNNGVIDHRFFRPNKKR